MRGRPELSVLTSLMLFRGRKAILNHAHALVSACPEYVKKNQKSKPVIRVQRSARSVNRNKDAAHDLGDY